MAEKKRKTLKSRLSLLDIQIENSEQFIKSFDTNIGTVFQLKTRNARLDDMCKEYIGINSEIMNLFGESGEEVEMEEFKLSFQLFEDKFFSLKSLYEELIYSFENNKPKEIKVGSDVIHSRINLPEIKIPEFDGSLHHWLRFKSSFEAMIIKNRALSEVQKLYYLNGCLSGDAKKAIETVEFSENGFQLAWKALNNRFDNTRAIIEKHIYELFKLRNVNKETSSDLNKLMDECSIHLNSLEKLGQNVKAWDMIIIHLISSRLDQETKKLWESSLDRNIIPTWVMLQDFLQKRSQVLASVEKINVSKLKPIVNQSKHNSGTSRAFVASNQSNSSSFLKCSVCKNNHLIYQCPEFLKLSPQKRYEKIRQLNLCLNCLKSNHRVQECVSHSRCQMCSKRHNTLLHMGSSGGLETELNSKHEGFKKTETLAIDDGSSIQNQSSAVIVKNNVSNSSNNRTFINIDEQDRTNENLENDSRRSSWDTGKIYSLESIVKNSQVLLSTAIVIVIDSRGKCHIVRSLLDSASQSNFMTQSLSELLELDRIEVPEHIVFGLNDSHTSINHMVRATIKSRVSKFEQSLQFHIVPQITSLLPSTFIDIANWSIPNNIELADPKFNIPNNVDLLLGAELFFKIMQGKQISLTNRLPILQKSLFGWILGGKVDHNICSNSSSRIDVTHAQIDANSIKLDIENLNCDSTIKIENEVILDKLIKSFWEIESIDILKELSREEKICENLFLETHSRDVSGRYMVKIPFHEKLVELGESRNMALRRFFLLEKKLNKNDVLRNEYSKFINEYISLGHMEPCLANNENAKEYFMPHHAILRPDSITTKLRVVFDASAKTTSGLSLNDVMLVGPVVQQELFDIILRFRKHLIAFTSDVEKMYRQILVKPEDRNLQKIFWREKESDPILEYKLNTITYGTAAAPYLATRTLNQMAIDHRKQLSLGSKIILEDMYVDDCLSGAESLEIAIESQKQLIRIFKNAGMNLRKWTSNSQEVLNSIDKEDVNITSENDAIKTLGLIWKPISDKFIFKLNKIDIHDKITKRLVLSEIAKLYDPLGLISPIIITAKIIMQQLWLENIDWDQQLPEGLNNIWNKFSSKLEAVELIEIDRCIISRPCNYVELHGFSDASQSAYGACIYVRSITDKNIVTKLVCAKSRVAPIKITSIPKLELNAALLLAQLVTRVLKSLDHSFDKVLLWSDSKIVLTWIKLPSYRLLTYVANRTSQIQELTSNFVWKHVRSKNNPADIVSRGVMPDELSNLNLWWNGPSFLELNEDEWPNSDSNINIEDIPEIKNQEFVFISNTKKMNLDIERFGSYTKIVRVMAYVHRFIHNAKNKSRLNRKYGSLTSSELETSLKFIVKLVQQVEFHADFHALKQNKPLPAGSKLNSLSPFLDADDILRVGGRLQNSNLTYNQKHQYLLPKNNNFTKLVFRHHHLKNLHGGVNFTLSSVRQKFWPLNGKNISKKIIHECIICFRSKPKLLEQIMGNLPPNRIEITHPFNVVGIDYAGPFSVRYKNQRKDTYHKVYVCLFVCFISKAVHLEVVEDATSATFIACLKRFIGRRGKPKTIWSDNGTNFVGAKNLLSDMTNLLTSSKEIEKFCTNESIEWNFIPPRSPHIGGLWESGIKSFKTHMKKIAVGYSLTLEHLYTITVQIEGILNSRPLTALSSDPTDLEPLTPAHFLIGRPINSLPEESIIDKSINKLKYWERVNQITQGFWKRFSMEYLHSLQQKKKWHKSHPNINVDDLVLVHEDNQPAFKWLLGRVTNVIKGKDEKVRICELQTKNGLINRAIVKLAKLPLETK